MASKVWASPLGTAALLGAVLVLAFVVRFWGIGWDSYAALHPDERHLFLVTQDLFDSLADPAHAGLGLFDWWFSTDSPLNPHLGTRSYVYGEAPLLAGALVGWGLGAVDWFDFMPVARALAAVVDTGAVLAVFLGARLLAGSGAALFAAVLYAAMPTALQLANFHTVDVWLGAATTAALVPLIALAAGRCGRGGALGMAAIAGAFIGLAVACKVTGVLMLAPATLALGLAARTGLGWRRALVAAGVLLLAALVVFRLSNPFAFAGPGLWGLALSDEWISDFEGLAWVTASVDFPPNWQWIAGYGPLRLLRDLTLFGAGPVAVALIAALPRHSLRGAALVPLAILVVFVALAAISSVAALRYAAPGLGALAVLLAPAARRIGGPAAMVMLALALFWGSGAVRLHDGSHPRIEASHFLWTLPRGTVLTNESGWDDPLPTIIRVTEGQAYRWPTHDDWFVLQGLDITDPDTPQKADRVASLLARTDYLILSSDRQSAVMPRLPLRFPMTTAHYAVLFSGQACFEPVLVLDRGYPLPFLAFDDSWAQEPWRVYDHPVVRIFQRQPCFNEANYRAMLHRALGF